MKKRFPVSPGAPHAADGSPAGADCEALTLLWSKLLGDPLGGTALANGRHQVKLYEPEAADTAPEFAPFFCWALCNFPKHACAFTGTRNC